MMTCKAVSTLVATGDLASSPTRQRLAVWFHLAMCRHCRAFRRQLGSLARSARSASAAFEAEPSSTFESTVVDHLRK